MSDVDTGIDWSAKPAPWCWIGPEFRRECRAIAEGNDPDGPRKKRPGRAELWRQDRQNRGLTQAQLAGRLGVSVATVNRIECGAKPSARVATLFDCFFHPPLPAAATTGEGPNR